MLRCERGPTGDGGGGPGRDREVRSPHRDSHGLLDYPWSMCTAAIMKVDFVHYDRGMWTLVGRISHASRTCGRWMWTQNPLFIFIKKFLLQDINYFLIKYLHSVTFSHLLILLNGHKMYLILHIIESMTKWALHQLLNILNNDIMSLMETVQNDGWRDSPPQQWSQTPPTHWVLVWWFYSCVSQSSTVQWATLLHWLINNQNEHDHCLSLFWSRQRELSFNKYTSHPCWLNSC